jgi:asparagine synthase (glutamine-hydrolysing)
MVSASGRQVITFNGEIYNFLELKDELQASGEVFHSSSDTEVLLTLLRRERTAALSRLDAMFAFGYYDIDTRQLVIARDIFGEKPLYYIDNDNIFAFASELSALTKLPGFDARIDQAAIASYLTFQYIPAPQSIYRAVRKLPPACFLKREPDGTLGVTRYFDFKTSSAEFAERPLDDLADELEAILITSLKRRLISDVPLGAFLSGGVDSSTVAGLASKKLGIKLKTFSIGFENYEQSEHYEAAEVARLLGTEHHERVLAPDAIATGRHIGTVLDEPNADSSCLPTFLLSGFTREKVTVALSGDGGDEMFGGYGRYFTTVDEWSRKRDGDLTLGWWNAGTAYISNRLLMYPDNVLRQAIGGMPPQLAAYLAEMRGAINADDRPLLNVLREVDALNYMPGAVLAKVDRMSMQHSLEVRAPLIGKDVAEFAMKLAADACYADGSGKRVLKQVASRYLPGEWMNRPKRGFGLPMDLWSADKLLPITERLLLADDARLTAWIDRGKLVAWLDALKINFNAYQTWALYILETWLRTHPAAPADDDVPLDIAIPIADAAVAKLKGALGFVRRWRGVGGTG